jgi:hypothetical protein
MWVTFKAVRLFFFFGSAGIEPRASCILGYTPSQSIDFEWSRFLSMMWAGLTQSTWGLERKKRRFPREEGILPQDRSTEILLEFLISCPVLCISDLGQQHQCLPEALLVPRVTWASSLKSLILWVCMCVCVCVCGYLYAGKCVCGPMYVYACVCVSYWFCVSGQPHHTGVTD